MLLAYAWDTCFYSFKKKNFWSFPPIGIVYEKYGSLLLHF